MNERIMKKIILLLIVSTYASAIYSQKSGTDSTSSFYIDGIAGPYLIVDHTLYKSVFLKGVRLGYEHRSGVTFGIEYLVGQQHDRENMLGTTHSAAGILQYYFLKNRDGRFNPYFLAGGGFFEFKDFSSDVLGVAFYGGLGTELNLSKNINGFLESRYVNLGPLNLEGKNELGVMWGLRARF